MKRNILTTALLAVMLVIAGCGGGGSGNADPVIQPSASDDTAAQIMARHLHEVLGLLGVNGDVHTTLSSNFEKFNLDDDLGRAVLTKTTETVPGVKPGWTGGHFKHGDKEARVYWIPEINENAYFYYGWWVDTDNDNGGYSLAFFVDGTTIANEGYVSQVVSAVTGSATYAGGAAGQYAIYSRVPKAHESGDFTADVMLNANFDTAKVSGTVTGFMVDGSEKNWSVALQENTDGLVEDRWVLGKALWEVNGTQPNNADQDASEYVAGFRDMDTDGLPIIAGGLFDVRNGNAKMYGSFGATKQ